MGRPLLASLSVAAILFVAEPSIAGQDEFCAGFVEGYKSVKGDLVIVPICPIAPTTPIGSTDFREGLKAGIRAAENGR